MTGEIEEEERSAGQGVDGLMVIERGRMRLVQVGVLDELEVGFWMEGSSERSGWMTDEHRGPGGRSLPLGSSWGGSSLSEEALEGDEIEGEVDRWRVMFKSWRRDWERASALDRRLRVG